MGTRIKTGGATVALTLALCVACGEAPPPDEDCTIGDRSWTRTSVCEGLDPDNCLLPWPSSRYLDEDPTTDTGLRVSIPADAMMANTSGVSVDPGPWNEWDGFSAATTMMAELPVRIDDSVLPSWGEDEPGLAEGSPTVLLDAETGERVAHFAEIEQAEDADPDRTTLYIRPAARLEEGRRYVVAIRGLTDMSGVPVPSSAYFAALRDGTPSDDPEVEDRCPIFETDVFAPLTAAGVAREDLILAWDFTTGSGRSGWGDLLDMSLDAFEAAGDDGISCALEIVTDTVHPDLFLELDGTFEVPFFLESMEDGARLNRDMFGRPLQNGTHHPKVRVIIPNSVAESVRAGEGPAPVLLYGHGLFNDRLEGTMPWLIEFAEREGFIVIATEFTGLATDDMLLVVEALTELSGFDAVFALVQQGIVNTLILPRTFARQCAGVTAELQIGGMPAVDPDRRWYHGNSQGGILGISLAALSPDIERFALGVGGIEYPIMLPRSINWPSTLEAILMAWYPSRMDRDVAMVMFSQRWELVEGSVFAPHATRDPLPGARARDAQILFQVGLHDTQTTNVASEIAGRTLGLPQSGTANRVWGLPTFDMDSPNAYVVFDFGVDPLPRGNASPTTENGVHEMVRRDRRAQDQIIRFLEEGLIAPAP